MSGDREVTSEQSSLVCEGVGYDEVYPLGHRPEKGLSWSSERESSANSPDDEEENYDREEVKDGEGGEMREDEDGYDEREGDGMEGKEEEEREEENEEDEGEDDESAPEGGNPRSLRDGWTCPFVLPAIWTVNDFKPMMTTNIFKNLPDCYQILENVLIHLPRKFEKCYSGKTADVGMYDAMFAAGLRLPLIELHC